MVSYTTAFFSTTKLPLTALLLPPLPGLQKTCGWL